MPRRSRDAAPEQQPPWRVRRKELCSTVASHQLDKASNAELLWFSLAVRWRFGDVAVSEMTRGRDRPVDWASVQRAHQIPLATICRTYAIKQGEFFNDRQTTAERLAQHPAPGHCHGMRMSMITLSHVRSFISILYWMTASPP
jgi:hypothetical protein